VQVFEFASGRQVLDLPEHESTAFSPDGRWFASASRSQVHLYRVNDWQRERVFERDEIDDTHTAAIAFQPAGPLLAYTTARGRIRLADFETGEVMATLTDPELRKLSSLCFSPDGTRLAFTGIGADVGIWDLHELRSELLQLGLGACGLPARTAPLPQSTARIEVVRGSELPPPDQWSKDWLTMARSEVLAASYADAVHAATQALSVLPEKTTPARRGEILTLRASYHRLNDNPHAARADWLEVLGLVPQQREATLMLARLYLLGPAEFRDTPRAGALLAPRVMAENPEPESLALWGLAQVRLGRYPEGKAILQKIEDAAQKPLALYFMAIACHHLSQLEEAQSSLRHAKDLHDRVRKTLSRIEDGELDSIAAEATELLKQ
jgi:hypothetical protein